MDNQGAIVYIDMRPELKIVTLNHAIPLQEKKKIVYELHPSIQRTYHVHFQFQSTLPQGK